MSKLTEQLRTIGIYNENLFAGHGNVYICYVPAYANSFGGAKWRVVKVGEATDPKAHWLDCGCKAFVVFGRKDKQEVLEEAKLWAGAKYGIQEWAKTPYGVWMDAGFVKNRLKELKEKLKDERI